MLQPLQRRIKGALVDRELSLRNLLDPLPDSPSMHRLERERLEGEKIDCSAKNV